MGFSSVIGASSVIRPGVCTSTTRPSSPYDGQVIYETNTDLVRVWDGAVWDVVGIGAFTSTTRPTNPYEGKVIYETDTDLIRVWNGSSWVAISSTNGAQFDSAGRMTLPNQPMFFVANENGSTISAGNKATFNVVVTNVGSHWSAANNRFTAPVTGYYEFTYSILNSAASAFYIEFRKNGTAMATGQYPRGYSGTQYVANTASGIMSLNANDYIEMWVNTGTMHSYHCFFSGKLIG